ncbi:hypothetical protein [Meiothermus sp. CFH 77666]|uniref:hypothetical protein n=1 Tax=Meiothermus sp. CFH 77666 TaxID=2817942 RepID=UPI001AA03DBE|nr:hypothetical protein [Meiothermus sp. CFH 77666]MBO1438336.1 hypothetical protein [Meiothermus sp. CFH 77666]
MSSLPYEIVGTPRTRALTAQSFEPGNQVLGLMSTVAKMEVPRNIAMVLRKGAPLQAYIKAVYETQGALTISGGNVVIDLGAQGIRLVQSQRQNPSFPTIEHLDIKGELSDDNGATWTETNVVSVNWQTGVVNLQLSIVPGANKARVFYLPGDGELQIAAEVPMGSDGSSAVFFNTSLRSLHSADQTNRLTAPTLGTAKDVFLAPEFILAIRVRSNSRIYWGNDAENIFNLPVIDTPIRVLDGPMLSRLAEQQLKG